MVGKASRVPNRGLRAARDAEHLDRDELAIRLVDHARTVMRLTYACDVTKIYRWEEWGTRPRGHAIRILVSFYATLGYSASDIGFDPQPAQPCTSDASSPTVGVPVDDGEAGVVDRREFVTGVAATGAGALPSLADTHHHLDRLLSGSTSGDIAYVQDAVERHSAGYRAREPETMLAEMRLDLALLRDLLTRPHRARDGVELARVVAGLCGLIAVIQHDRGAVRDAHSWAATAANAAQDAGDRRTLAWVLAREAMVPLNYGSPTTAAGLAVRARREAGGTPSPASALATAVSARALAALGQHQQALRAVDDARTIAASLTAAEQADTWFGYPPHKHHVHLSQALTLLGRTDEADVEQRAALAHPRSGVMARALIEIDAATCAFMDGDRESSAERAVKVWTALPLAYQDGLIRTRVRALHQRMSGVPQARLAEALRGA